MKEIIYRVLTAIGAMTIMFGSLIYDYYLFNAMAAKYPGSWYWTWGMQNANNPIYMGVNIVLIILFGLIVASVGYDAFKMLKEMRKER